MPSRRAVYAVAAWVAATATAMGVVWAGLDSVIPAATAGPHVATIAAWPVQDAASAGSATSTLVAPTPQASSSSLGAAATVTRAATKSAAPPTSSASKKASSAASAAATTPSAAATTASSAATTSAGTENRYTTPGGTAVLTLYSDHATLDVATPASGFSARSWSTADELEVEFSPSDASTVYEVIATWNGTSPQVNTYAVGG